MDKKKIIASLVEIKVLLSLDNTKMAMYNLGCLTALIRKISEDEESKEKEQESDCLGLSENELIRLFIRTLEDKMEKRNKDS